jgi:hypothetical protein
MSDEYSNSSAGPRSNFRFRFSLLALLILVTVVSAILGWAVYKKPVVATALFQINNAPAFALNNQQAQSAAQDSEIFKKTQIALIKSSFVLTSSIRAPGIASVSILAGKKDPVAWLQDHLEVEFLENSDILAIKLRGMESQTQDLVLLVDAVAKAYADEALGAEQQRLRAELDLLSRSLETANQTLNRNWEDYLDISRETGTIETESGQALQQIDLKRLEHIDDELMRLEYDQLKAAANPAGLDPKAIEQRIVQLRQRQDELEKKIGSRAAKSGDLVTRKQQLEQFQRIVNELVAMQERLEIESQRPGRIRQVQPAVIERR